jgi:hypothetical protein
MYFNLKDGKFVVLPSGELHIKDVRPEDGLKEYRSPVYTQYIFMIFACL